MWHLLLKHDFSIILHSKCTLRLLPQRVGDIFIMNSSQIQNLSIDYQFPINHCRLYLHTLYISDIFHISKPELLSKITHHTPLTSQYSCPNIPKPRSKDWLVWDNYLQEHITPTLSSLGEWNITNYHVFHEYYHSHNGIFQSFKFPFKLFHQYSSSKIYKSPSLLYSPKFTLISPYSPCTVIKLPSHCVYKCQQYTNVPRLSTLILPSFTYQIQPSYHQKLTNYLAQHPLPTYLFLVTDGSYKYPVNYSDFVLEDTNNIHLLSHSGIPNSLPASKSSYDSEVYALVLGLQSLVWIQSILPLRVKKSRLLSTIRKLFINFPNFFEITLFTLPPRNTISIFKLWKSFNTYGLLSFLNGNRTIQTTKDYILPSTRLTIS